MKTNMLILSLIISAAASAQSGVSANSSTKSELTVKKGHASVTSQGGASTEAAAKSNKISGEASLQERSTVSRKSDGSQGSEKAASQVNGPAKPGAGQSLTATEKGKMSLTTSTSKIKADKQAESNGLAKAAAGSAKSLNARAQSGAKAGIATSKAVNASVQKNAKATVSGASSATVKNAGRVKMAIKPRPVSVNTQVRSITAVKIR